MTPVLDPKRDLAGAKPETLARDVRRQSGLLSDAWRMYSITCSLASCTAGSF